MVQYLIFENYNYQAGTTRSQDGELESTLIAIEEEFTWKEINTILDFRYNELMLEMSHYQAVEVLKREYNTQYIDDII